MALISISMRLWVSANSCEVARARGEGRSVSRSSSVVSCLARSTVLARRLLVLRARTEQELVSTAGAAISESAVNGFVCKSMLLSERDTILLCHCGVLWRCRDLVVASPDKLYNAKPMPEWIGHQC